MAELGLQVGEAPEAAELAGDHDAHAMAGSLAASGEAGGGAGILVGSGGNYNSQ